MWERVRGFNEPANIGGGQPARRAFPCDQVADRGARRAAQRKRCHHPVDGRCLARQVAPGAYHMVLGDVPPARPSGWLRAARRALAVPVQFLLRGGRIADRAQLARDALSPHRLRNPRMACGCDRSDGAPAGQFRRRTPHRAGHRARTAAPGIAADRYQACAVSEPSRPGDVRRTAARCNRAGTRLDRTSRRDRRGRPQGRRLRLRLRGAAPPRAAGTLRAGRHAGYQCRVGCLHRRRRVRGRFAVAVRRLGLGQRKCHRRAGLLARRRGQRRWPPRALHARRMATARLERAGDAYLLFRSRRLRHVGGPQHRWRTPAYRVRVGSGGARAACRGGPGARSCRRQPAGRRRTGATAGQRRPVRRLLAVHPQRLPAIPALPACRGRGGRI